MNLSRHFFIVTGTILLLSASLYYVITKGILVNRAQAENLSQLDSYLSKNFSLTLNLPKRTEDAVRIYCDQSVATTTAGSVSIAYPCQNQNPSHKIVIGWASNGQSFMMIMKSLGSDQLYWKYYPYGRTQEGKIDCTERADYGNYKNALYGLDCVQVTGEGEKLYASVLFFEDANTSKYVFLAVLNTVKSTSAAKVERELLTLRSKQDTTTKLGNLMKSLVPQEIIPKEDMTASTSVSFSIEADIEPAGSFSRNTITNITGNIPDASVCDITDMASCYPLYCESLTSVWNFSLNRCVEPDVSTTPFSLEKKCESTSMVWDGSRCREFVGNIISSNVCTIPAGESSCKMEVFWSVQFPQQDIELRHQVSDTESIIVSKGSSGMISHIFSYSDKPYVIDLYDGRQKINSGVFITRCLNGGWNPTLQMCVNPQVDKTKLIGEYYALPGTLSFTCKDADTYSVSLGDDGTIIATGTYVGEVLAPISKSGNYAIVCLSGALESNPTVRYYNAPPPPPPTISFVISPRTISKNEKTVLNWTIDFPKEQCDLAAKVICRNNSCNSSQMDFENELNQSIQTESTDEDDPATSRALLYSLKNVAPGHLDNDWKALGKKSFALLYTTDFTLSCGEGLVDKKRVYVRGEK